MRTKSKKQSLHNPIHLDEIMKYSFLLLLVITPVISFCQATKKITDKVNNESYYVLKSDKSTKHGEYKKYSILDKLLVQGYYKQGKKDSIWESYDLAGKLILKYDFQKNQVISYNPDKSKVVKDFRLLKGVDSLDSILTRPPILIGGDDLILNEFIKNLRYPSAALENGKSGKVYVVFTVDKNGKTSNHHVVNNLGFGLDEEAIRVLKLIPDDWLPGLSNENPVDVEITYPVTFNLK